MEQAAIKFSAAATTNQCQDEYSKDCTHKLKFKFKLRCSYFRAQLHNSVAPKSYWRYVNAIYWCEYVEAVQNRESCCIYPSVVTSFMESVNCICRDHGPMAKDLQKPQLPTTNAWFHVSWYWWSFWLLLILYYNQYPELWSCVLTVTSYSFLQSTKEKGKQKGMTKVPPHPDSQPLIITACSLCGETQT